MNVTTTGIAAAVAIVVVGVVFIFPNLSPFSSVSSTASTTDLSVAPGVATTTSSSPSMPTTITTADGLQITDEVVGTGATAVAGDTVTVDYVGQLTDGTVFDASANHGTTGFTFPLGANQVIKGWDEGVAGMQVGGTRKLVIPAALGYGSQAVSTIPANSTLVFKVTLRAIQGK